MKKNLILFLAIFVVFTTIQAQSPGCLCLGDLDRDGEITQLDADSLVSLITLGEFDPCADINLDGMVDLLDVAGFQELLESGIGCGCECLGDVDRDGAVTLLDVQVAVDILVSGEFDPCLDLNDNGVIDLLDINLLADLLGSGRQCGCVCLGDLDGDGVVSLLDLTLFVEILTSGGYDGCADIDGDGVISLLDINLFAEILQKGGDCGSLFTQNGNASLQKEASKTIAKLYEQLGLENPATGLKLFPNPASNNINVQFDMIQSGATVINVYNVSGQIVYTKEMLMEAGPHTMSIHTNELASGLYFIEVDNGNTVRKGKFTVE